MISKIQEIADLAVVSLMKERFTNTNGQVIELPASNVQGVVKLPDTLPINLEQKHYDITIEWGGREDALSIEGMQLEIIEPLTLQLSSILQEKLQGEWLFVEQDLEVGRISAVSTNKCASIRVSKYFESTELKNLMQFDVVLVKGKLI